MTNPIKKSHLDDTINAQSTMLMLNVVYDISCFSKLIPYFFIFL